MKGLEYDRKNNLSHAQQLNGSCLMSQTCLWLSSWQRAQDRVRERRDGQLIKVVFLFILSWNIISASTRALGSTLCLKIVTQFGDYQLICLCPLMLTLSNIHIPVFKTFQHHFSHRKLCLNYWKYGSAESTRHLTGKNIPMRCLCW